MDLRKLKTLIDLVSESNVSELEITEAEGKVRIVKSSGAPVVMQQPAMTMVAAPVAGVPAAAEAAPAAPAGHAVKSPMVARFTVPPALAPSLLSNSAAWSRKAKRSASLRP